MVKKKGVVLDYPLKKIFQEIDQAIKDNRSPIPVPINQSNFYKEYLKIKERYTQ